MNPDRTLKTNLSDLLYGSKSPAKKVGVIVHIFKPAKPHRPWDACCYIHAADSARLFETNNVRSHMYADDSMIDGMCHLTVQLQRQMSAYVDDVAIWKHCSRLQLNTAKTEVTRCTLEALSLIHISEPTRPY